MSLILEALRKLERDKAAPERGFVVMAASAWPTERKRRGVLLSAGLVAGAAVAGIAIWAAMREGAPARPTLADAAPAGPPAVAPPATEVPPPPEAPVPAAANRVTRSHAETARPAVSPPTTAAATGAPGARDPVEDPITASVARGESPTRVSPRALRLQAISQRDGRPIALLNDRLVREGEEFDGVLIVAIRTDEVEVEVDGRRTVLKF